MADKFSNFGSSLTGPASNAAIVTPNDTADLPNVSRALLLSGPAIVTVDMVGIGTEIALPLIGGVNAIRVSRVYATGTDSVSIVALW